MGEVEFLVLVNIAAIAGGMFFAWVMNLPLWKGAVVAIAGLVASVLGAVVLSEPSAAISTGSFLLGTVIAASAMRMSFREGAWVVGGSMVGSFAAGFLIATGN